jgi:hypothetical protein
MKAQSAQEEYTQQTPGQNIHEEFSHDIELGTENY